MESFEHSQTQQESSLKRRASWQDRLSAPIQDRHRHRPSFFTRLAGASSSSSSIMANLLPPPPPNGFPAAAADNERLVSCVVPPVTVVLEGRSICQRISLHKHSGYQSLARALRHMFVDDGDGAAAAGDGDKNGGGGGGDLDLSNAVPGHLIAYEDMENDLLLVGDLNWKDFVKVAKRIRVLPVKRDSRKGRQEEQEAS